MIHSSILNKIFIELNLYQFTLYQIIFDLISIKRTAYFRERTFEDIKDVFEIKKILFLWIWEFELRIR